MSQFQSWTAGIPLSIPPRVDQFPGGTVAIPKGDVVITNDAGQIITATVALSGSRQHFVAIRALTDTSGDVKTDIVGPGQRVTVETSSILEPGDGVKVSATDGQVQLFVVASDDIDLRIGTYIGVEPGVYSKDSATPFAEGFSTDSGPEVNAAAGQIVAIELR